MFLLISQVSLEERFSEQLFSSDLIIQIISGKMLTDLKGQNVIGFCFFFFSESRKKPKDTADKEKIK